MEIHRNEFNSAQVGNRRPWWRARWDGVAEARLSAMLSAPKWNRLLRAERRNFLTTPAAAATIQLQLDALSQRTNTPQ